MRPSETSQGRAWLSNFSLDEQRAAALLIDGLRIISSSQFRLTLTAALSEAVDELPRPVGVYPARELPRKHNYEFAPLDHPYQSTPGSEGLVGNIIRDVIGRRPKLTQAATYAPRDQLRERKVRSILLVDDYSGTGDQLSKYVDAWMDHATIKSWHSYGLLRLHVLVLTASKAALRRLRDHRFVTGLRHHETGGDFDSVSWTSQEKAAVEDLCVRYAKNPDYALGYRQTRGLLVQHHTVPNNLPMVLWQTESPKVKPWLPFFADRTMTPRQQGELDDYRMEVDATRIAAILKQDSLGEALHAQSNPTVRVFLLVLGALERGHRDPTKLATLLHLSDEAALRTLEACRGLALVDGANRLTDEGRRELRRARSRTVTTAPVAAHNGSDAPYYPVSLRGADDI